MGLLSILLQAGCASKPSLQQWPAQKPDAQARNADRRVSLYLGQAVPHPEELSGLWEAVDGQGGFVGLQLILSTTVPASATSLRGKVQKWQNLSAGIYRRAMGSADFQEVHYFTDWPDEGLHYTSGRLAVHAAGFDVDLHRSGDGWTGHIQQGSLEGHYKLLRPLTTPTLSTWYLGEWMQAKPVSQTVLHVGRAQDGVLLSWTDTLSEWGHVRVADGLYLPDRSPEQFGNLAMVKPLGSDGLDVQLGSDRASCCPTYLTLHKVNQGLMTVVWPAAPQGTHPDEWHRVRLTE